MKIVESNGQYRITLPKDLVKDKNWDKNTKLRFIENTQGQVILKEI